MKRILDKITPSFIKNINESLLKNNILGWQLQLPQILWLWFLISIITLPIAFLYPINLLRRVDYETMLGISSFLAVLQFFLFGYILIQFNSSKAFGKRSLLYGLKEQLRYLLVMFLCLTNVIIHPFIIEWRKSTAISLNTIKKETEIYNKARYYFMDNANNYRYFPNKQYFLNYKFRLFSEYDSSVVNPNDYYIRTIEPLLKPYFSNRKVYSKIDSKYTRKENGPQLYYIGDDYIYHYYSNDLYNYNKIKRNQLNYLFEKKSDSERLNDIKNFISLYKKYEKLYSKYSYYDNSFVKFKDPKSILENYKSNQFKVCVKVEVDYSYSNDVSNQLTNEVIERIHSTVLRAEEYKWIHLGYGSLACFFIAFSFSLLLFVFKNVRLKEFIVSFVYAGLIALTTIVLMILTQEEEFVGLHTLILLFFIGIISLISSYSWKHFSSFKLILIIYTNVMFAFVPIFFFLYFYEYMGIGKLNYNYCNTHADICEAHRILVEKIRWISLWSGVCLYLLVGSVIYKKAYEKIYALPLNK